MIISSIAALITPAVVFVVAASVHGHPPWDESMPSMLVMVLILSALHFLFLALPALLAIRWLDKLSLVSVILVGFFAAVLPSAVDSWPMPAAHPIGVVKAKLFGVFVEETIDGVPTIWGWFLYLENLVLIGVLFGITSAVVFWFCYRQLSKTYNH